MLKWKIYTPEGVQDILFDECVRKKELENIARNVFKVNGFFELEPPSIEFYDVFCGELGNVEQESMFKFFDQQGRILVLRPDITTSIARIASTKLSEKDFPARFFYIGNVFRFDEQVSARIKQREFTQAGIEVLGYEGPEADAEVLATVIETIRKTGLEKFQIEIGQVEFFKGLMEQAGFDEKESEQLRALVESKNYFGIEMALKDKNIESAIKESITKLPGMFGDIRLIDEIYNGVKNDRSRRALDNIKEICKILEEYGYEEYISIDLGMVQSLDYYTGMIFKGITHEVAFSICGGGRYDKLTKEFGKTIPATGGEVGINRLLLALERQNINIDVPTVETLVAYEPEGRTIALQIAQELRRQGLMLELSLGAGTLEDAVDYAKDRRLKGVIFASNGEVVKVCDIIEGETTETTINELLNKV